MEKKNFFDRLFDAKDNSVDAGIFFTFLAIFGLIVYALVQVILNWNNFHLMDFAASCGTIFTGSGVHMISKGAQDKLNPSGAPTNVSS